MTGLDTNVVIRHITQDDPVQSPKASQIMERSFTQELPGFISVATILETAWVLENFYDLTPRQTADAMQQILQVDNLHVQEERAVLFAVRALRSGADFADALIGELGLAAGCTHTLTFDRKASRLPGFELIA